MPAIAFAVPAARGHACIEINRVGRSGLQDMEDVQADDQLRGAAFLTLHAEGAKVAAPPQVSPSEDVAYDKFPEASRTRHRGERRRSRIGARPITGGEQRDDLFCRHAFATSQLDLNLLPDIGGFAHRFPEWIDRLFPKIETDAARLDDTQTRLRHLGLETHRVRHGAGLERAEMVIFEWAISGHAGVADPAVDRDSDGHRPGPVLGRDCHVLRREVPVLHVDEALLLDAYQSPLRVAQADEAVVEAAVKVEILPVLNDFGRRFVYQPAGFAFACDPDVERQPVWQVDQILVLDGAIRDLRDKPIIAACDVCAGIVHAVGPFVGRCASRGEEAVAHSEQRFAATLEMRIEAVVGKDPSVSVGVVSDFVGQSGRRGQDEVRAHGLSNSM